jgi:hypothetical protein
VEDVDGGTDCHTPQCIREQITSRAVFIQPKEGASHTFEYCNAQVFGISCIYRSNETCNYEDTIGIRAVHVHPLERRA